MLWLWLWLLQTQMGTHLAIAKKCNPGFSERFNLFVKEREHSQESESDNSGEGAKDLVSIVEFQVCVGPIRTCSDLTKSIDMSQSALNLCMWCTTRLPAGV